MSWGNESRPGGEPGGNRKGDEAAAAELVAVQSTPSRCRCSCHLTIECIADELEREFASIDEQVTRRIRETSWNVAASHDWQAESRKLTHAELRLRRGDAA